MLTLLLSLCLGLINAARGDGIKLIPFFIPDWKIIPVKLHNKLTSCTKPIVLLAIYIGHLIICNNPYISLLGPVLLGISWGVDGGTGGYHAPVIKALSFLRLGNNAWRFFEFLLPFIYTLILGAVCALII